MGKAVGELSVAFATLSDKGTTETAPLSFCELDTLHPLSGTAALVDFIQNPPFEIKREGVARVRQLLNELKERHTELERLPRQIVHHDLLIFNLLTRSDGTMSGVLDFDFASRDIRAIELAVCLNHLLQFHPGLLEPVRIFMKVFSAEMRLNADEMKQLPFLMNIYYVALLTIYVGQHASGKDVQHAFTYIFGATDSNVQLASRSQ
ncbi:phosphotransferase [Paenibacillus sp. OV219]|uniref:phosphotransferase n=1 Tax=Paenibacillus sp. OV219 TaxID=1884377 RepID=UPI0011608EC2|nr:phosphotransferase [Paenibacillus sp. OV219]